MTDKPQSPAGVVCLLIAPDGRVVAHTADFHPDRPGGFTVTQAQRSRARLRLSSQAFYAMSNHDLARACDPYHAEQIIEALCRKAGYRVETIEVGGKPESGTEES